MPSVQEIQDKIKMMAAHESQMHDTKTIEQQNMFLQEKAEGMLMEANTLTLQGLFDNNDKPKGNSNLKRK